MVYKKGKFTKRKKKYGKRKPRYTVKKNAMAIKKIKKDVEYKRMDIVVNESPLTITQSGIFRLVNGLYQGTEQDERIGSVVCNKKLHVRALFRASADCVVRFGILRWEDVNADSTPLAMSYIFQNVSHGGTANSGSVLAMKNIQNNNRYKVVYDDIISMDTTQFSIVPFVYTHKMNSKTEYVKDSTSSVQEEILKNAYFLYFATDRADSQPTVELITRWTYTDM